MEYASLLELAKNTRSIRRFKPDPVPDEDIDKIIEVARWAPSGFNQQPWEFIVVRKPELRKKIAEYTGIYWSQSGEMEATREAWQGAWNPEPVGSEGGQADLRNQHEGLPSLPHDLFDSLVDIRNLVGAGGKDGHSLLGEIVLDRLPVVGVARLRSRHATARPVRRRVQAVGLTLAANHERRVGHRAGDHSQHSRAGGSPGQRPCRWPWMPAFAGMTARV